MRNLALFAVLLVCCVVAPVQAQIKPPEIDPKGPQLGETQLQKLRVGVIVTAVGGPCKGIVATVPVPTEWPEQQVRNVAEEISPLVNRISYKMIGGTVRQMRIEIPQIPAGQKVEATVTFEIQRSTLLPPKDTSIYALPNSKKFDREMLIYTRPSPYIESGNPKITSLAKELVGDKESAWDKVAAIYDGTRERVAYKNGPLKGALKALNDKDGDCEELSSLFIAMCRAQKIPARTIWVDGHCYPEFYLVDDDNKGHWFPCQAAGTRDFGGIPEKRAILQKGDSFKDPDRPRDKLRYVSEFLQGSGVKGGGKPSVKWIRETL